MLVNLNGVIVNTDHIVEIRPRKCGVAISHGVRYTHVVSLSNDTVFDISQDMVDEIMRSQDPGQRVCYCGKPMTSLEVKHVGRCHTCEVNS